MATKAARPKMTFRDAAQTLCQVIRDMPVSAQENGAKAVGYTMEDLDEAIAVVQEETGLGQ